MISLMKRTEQGVRNDGKNHSELMLISSISNNIIGVF
jgi:hypothetical protein